MDAGNKRIAKNTLYMYIRLFVTIVIGLYTSRVVLQILGVSDYGLYSVVGGVLSMLAFVRGSLGQATSRFLNTEMGKKDGDVNRVFNVNLTLHTILAIIVFLLAETIGLWYINNKLTVEPGKLSDALFLFQVATLTSLVGIVNAPYASLFTAHERFGFLAKFDIINTLIRLSCIVLLSIAPADGVQLSPSFSLSLLRLYALIICLTTANTFVVYHWLAARNWPEIIRLRLVKGWRHYRGTLVFSNWNLLATTSMMARSTGCDLILNSFFGTAINGAFAISRTINEYAINFTTNFDGTSGPQIVQAYAAKDFERCYYLVNKIGRFGLLLFEFILFPLYIELDWILHLWLGSVPENVLLYSQLYLTMAAVSLTCGGLAHLINASGKIKWFKINLSCFFLLCIPAGYILLSQGWPAHTIIVLFIIADVLQRMVQLILLKNIINFDALLYIKEAYLRPFAIAAIMVVVLYAHTFIDDMSVWTKLLSIILCAIINTCLILTCGLSASERSQLLATIKSRAQGA